MLFLPAIAALLLQTATAPDSARGAGARNPAYARDGRLAVSVQGDLWIVSKQRRVDARHVGRRPGIASRRGRPTARRSSSRPTAPATSICGASPSGRAARRRARAAHDVAAARRTARRRARRAHLLRARPPRRGGAVGAPAERRRSASDEGSRRRAMAGDVDRRRARRVRRRSPTARESFTFAISTRARDSVVLTDARVEHPAWAPAGDRLELDRDRARAARCTSRRSTDATSIS